MSYSRVSLYRRDGSWMTTIKTETERSWVLNDYGLCKFTFSLNDAKAIQKYLEFGTLIHIENDLLPAWAGVLDPDEDWVDDGTIHMNAYSGEYLLKFRRSPLNQVFEGGSAGTLFKKMIDQANIAGDLLIRTDSIWQGGTPAQDTMDGKLFYDHIKGLASNRSNDWSIEPRVNPANSRLYFAANYYERRGTVKKTTFKEGFNVKRRGSPLKVQRMIVNDLLGIGEGSDTERATWIETDPASIARYGLRQGTKDLTKTAAGSVQADTIALLRDLRNPRRTFSLELLNIGNEFVETRLGNIHPLVMQTVGFSSDGTIGVNANVRVLGMRYYDNTDTMELIVDEAL